MKITHLTRLKRKNEGAALVEYGILVGIIAVTSIGAVLALGGEIKSNFQTIASEIALPGAAPATATQASVNTYNPLAAAACYDPSNVNTIGTATGCENMLIVSSVMMQAKKSPSYGGDGTFAFPHSNGITYTFAENGNDVFTGQVTNFSFLFHNSPFNGDISYWDTSRATSMREMFWNTSNFDGDLSGWRTSLVQDMNATFGYAASFTGSVQAWDTGSVTDMGRMFLNAPLFNEDLSGWCASNIATRPLSFDDFALAWTDPAYRPDWGTCPAN